MTHSLQNPAHGAQRWGALSLLVILMSLTMVANAVLYFAAAEMNGGRDSKLSRAPVSGWSKASRVA